MTPETHAALGRVIAFLDAFEDDGTRPQGAISTLRTEGLRLTATDLRTLLAALDPADQPSDVADITPAGRAIVNGYRAHRTPQHPRTVRSFRGVQAASEPTGDTEQHPHTRIGGPS